MITFFCSGGADDGTVALDFLARAARYGSA